MDRYLAAVEAYQSQLEGHRQMDAEEYHILKIRLETDIQVGWAGEWGGWGVKMPAQTKPIRKSARRKAGGGLHAN